MVVTQRSIWNSCVILESNSWIEQTVAQVHQQIDQDENYDENQHRALNNRVVPIVDALKDELAQPRPLEDRLGDNGAAKELAELKNQGILTDAEFQAQKAKILSA